MIDKLEEVEGLSYSIGDFHITDQESKDRLKQLRKEINQALKLQELVKGEMNNIIMKGTYSKIFNEWDNPEIVLKYRNKLQSLIEESEKSGEEN